MDKIKGELSSRISSEPSSSDTDRKLHEIAMNLFLKRDEGKHFLFFN